MTVTFSSGETLNFANAVVMGAIAMVAGLIIVPLVSLCTYKLEVKKGILDVEATERMFDCFKGKVVVSRKSSLGDEVIDEVANNEEVKEEILSEMVEEQANENKE